MEQRSDIEPSVVFGPLYPFICDEEIEEIWINSPDRIFVARSGVAELTDLQMTAEQVRDLVERMLNAGRINTPTLSA